MSKSFESNSKTARAVQSLSRRTFFKGLASSAGVASLPLLSGCASHSDPFLHSVASGDPLADRVIIWTRITAYNATGEIASTDEQPLEIPYQWMVSLDPEFTSMVVQGEGVTSASRDFTVKEDVIGLSPGTTYYYRFVAEGWYSPTGRTKTLPVGHVERLRIAFTSCSNWTYGHFNVYGAIAARQDLDVVLHLGDYIYEYGDSYSSSKSDRVHSPNHEIITLRDYRLRHSQYKTDDFLQEAHRQNAFITVWDDHETANDAYKDGAQNHNEKLEGAWAARRQYAIQAYFEWMPIREVQKSSEGINLIYRDFRFGDLMDLLMLDTRIAGRTKQSQIGNLNTLNDPEHTLLGEEQEQWLYQKLDQSKADNTAWRVLGQQVMMGHFSGGAIGFNMDQWDGYPKSRERLFNHIIDNNIDNFVVLTGDIHSSWAMDLAPNPFSIDAYDPATGEGSIGVEFVTPGVSSPGIPDPVLSAAVSTSINAAMPHMKMVDFYYRGHVLLDITHSQIQAEWHWVRTIHRPTTSTFFRKAFKVLNGQSGLSAESTATAPLASPPQFAPKQTALQRVV